LPVSQTAYNANNQQSLWGTANIFYDANGNMTSSGTDGYTWDARNRLVSTLWNYAANRAEALAVFL